MTGSGEGDREGGGGGGGEQSYDENDFAYALAQLTDDCDHQWIRDTTGLSHDECDKILRIAYAAQKRVFK